MVRVLIDNQVYENQTFGGISRYFNELRLDNHFIKKMDLYVNENAEKNNILNRIERKLTKVIFNQTHRRNEKYQFYISQLSNLQFDIFHPTYYDNYFLEHLKKPFVLTVHDMIHEKYAEYFGNSFDSINKRRLCEKADKIIAISNTTKNDLIDIFQIPEKKIEVIYHGTNFNSVSSVRPKLDFQGMRYLLFIGNRSIYKNFLTFLIAVSPILHQNKDLQLICSGPTFNNLEIRWIKDLGLENKIKSFYCNSDNELAYLYQNAECFIFPSLYEGFGFPILEAFSCNCPVVSSNGGSLKEIGANAAFYFNPKDIIEMRESINKVISDEGVKKELVELGKNRLKEFSWEKCRLETNLLYSKLV